MVNFSYDGFDASHVTDIMETPYAADLSHTTI